MDRLFDEIKRSLDGANRLYGEAGKGLAGNLHCCSCSRDEAVSAEQASSYLRGGWPMCCGRMMVLQVESQETTDA